MNKRYKMKTAGLIGGMCWPSTVYYYETVNKLVNEKLGGLSSAKCLIYCVDYEDLINFWKCDEWDKSAEVVINVAQNLEKGGADFIAMCCNTVHYIYDVIQRAVRIPVIHIIDPVIEELKEQRISKVGLLGTRFTMKEDFHKKRIRANGIEILVPNTDDCKKIDDIIYNELVFSKINEKSKDIFLSIIDEMILDGVQGIILGCTEIGLLISKKDTVIPLFDSSKLHAYKIVQLLLE